MTADANAFGRFNLRMCARSGRPEDPSSLLIPAIGVWITYGAEKFPERGEWVPRARSKPDATRAGGPEEVLRMETSSRGADSPSTVLEELVVRFERLASATAESGFAGRW